MANQKKQDTVASITASLEKANVIALTDYGKLTHQQLEALRNKIKEANGAFSIVKNSLLKLALKKLDNNQDANPVLTGPTALIAGSENDLSPLKILYEATKENETLIIKGGIWNHEAVNTDHVIRLATLPSKNELVAKLLGQLKSSTVQLVVTLKNPLTKLTVALAAIREQKAGLPAANS